MARLSLLSLCVGTEIQTLCRRETVSNQGGRYGSNRGSIVLLLMAQFQVSNRELLFHCTGASWEATEHMELHKVFVNNPYCLLVFVNISYS